MLRTSIFKAGTWPHILPRGLLLLLFAFLTQTATAAERRVALLIGNASYQHEKPLKNPINDAELLGRVLKDDLRFDDVRVERNLNVHAMDKVVADFAQRAQGADSVVFYYSGHGIKSSDRRSFLLPIDARTGSGDAPALDRQAVSAESVRDKLKAAGARVTLVILDACRDGPGSGKSGSKGLARIGGANGLLVAYATEEDQVAADGLGRNSPYAQALAQALKRTDMPLLAQLDMVGDEVHRIAPSQAPTREGNLRADAYLVSPFGRITPQQQGNLHSEPVTLTAHPRQANGLNLEDLQKEEETRQAWAKWQWQMKVDFEKTARFVGSSDLQAKAWERFLAAWGKDNPLSREDDELRSLATQRQQTAKQQSEVQASSQAVDQSQNTHTQPAGWERVQGGWRDNEILRESVLRDGVLIKYKYRDCYGDCSTSGGSGIQAVAHCETRQRSDVARDGSYQLRDVHFGTLQSLQLNLACKLALNLP